MLLKGGALVFMFLGFTSATHPQHLNQINSQLKANEGSPETCMALHCAWQIGQCFFNQECYDTIMCMQDCEGLADEFQCQFTCEMSLGMGNELFAALVNCMAENGCFPEVPPDGHCLAGPEDAVAGIEDFETIYGDWWVVKGVNCGQEEWPGAYDWYPCQHARFVLVEDDWVNNTTYCGGQNSVCETDIIVTIPVATLPSSGYIRLDYGPADAPLLPQVEKWYVVSWPEPDYMFVFWCGENPALTYNGGYVLSRNRNIDAMKPETEAVFRQLVADKGLDFDNMCLSDNTHCPE